MVASLERAIGAVVARFVHTEEVTGSNPVSPTWKALVRSMFGRRARGAERITAAKYSSGCQSGLSIQALSLRAHLSPVRQSSRSRKERKHRPPPQDSADA